MKLAMRLGRRLRRGLQGCQPGQAGQPHHDKTSEDYQFVMTHCDELLFAEGCRKESSVQAHA